MSCAFQTEFKKWFVPKRALSVNNALAMTMRRRKHAIRSKDEEGDKRESIADKETELPQKTILARPAKIKAIKIVKNHCKKHTSRHRPKKGQSVTTEAIEQN